MSTLCLKTHSDSFSLSVILNPKKTHNDATKKRPAFLLPHSGAQLVGLPASKLCFLFSPHLNLTSAVHLDYSSGVLGKQEQDRNNALKVDEFRV